MDIGSAKIKPDEMEGVPHHLIDILEPWESFDVVRFQGRPRSAGWNLPAGGHPDPGGRDRILHPVRAEGRGFHCGRGGCRVPERAGGVCQTERRRSPSPASSQGRPCRCRPDTSQQCQAHHPRAEYYRQTGQPISAHNEQERQKKPCYRCAYFVLNDRRDRLYEAIGRRVDQMMEEGLLGEVRRLRDMGCRRDMVSMQGLGYKELWRTWTGNAPWRRRCA